MKLEDAIKYIDQYNIRSLQLEGGDPLCVSPGYIQTIIDHVKQTQPDIQLIGITTNLWDFYKRPQKWLKIFQDPLVDVCTSFQFGKQRKITTNNIFDLDKFLSIYQLYNELVKKPLAFIAVLNEETEQYTIETVKLAKQLKTQCKINRQIQVGRAQSSYPFEKAIAQYCNIINHGLENYENNSFLLKQLLQYGSTGLDSCPFSRKCQSWQIAINPDGQKTFCDFENSRLHLNLINKKNIVWINDVSTVQSKRLIKSDCLICKYFDICNGCKHTINEVENVDSFCNNIKFQLDSIVKNLN